MNVLSVKTSSSMVRNGKKMSETKLLTPDDWIIKERIARKHRWALSTRQLQRRQLQVVNQLVRNDL